MHFFAVIARGGDRARVRQSRFFLYRQSVKISPHQHDWPVAVEKTCQFKDLLAGMPIVTKAEELARRIVG